MESHTQRASRGDQNALTSGTAPEWSAVSSSPKNAQDRIISAASNLFCRQGFAATGVDQIVSEAQTAKSTLYSRFGSKENLIEAVLQAEGAAWRKWIFGRLAACPGGPGEQIEELFAILKEWFDHPDFYGCAFINAVSEAHPDDTRIRGIAVQHKSHLVKWLKAQALDLGLDPEPFVQTMIVLIDGAIVAAQASGRSDFADVAKHIAAKYVNEALGPISAPGAFR